LPDGRVNVFNARQRLPGESPFPPPLPSESRHKQSDAEGWVVVEWVGQWVVQWVAEWRRHRTKVGQTLTDTHTHAAAHPPTRTHTHKQARIVWLALVCLLLSALSAASTSLFNFSCGSGQGFDL